MARRPVTSRRGALAVLFMVSVVATGCGEPPEAPTRTRASARRYPLTGTVVRLQHETGVAVIKHDEIPGWMEAMTMEFPLELRSDLRRLRPGDRIRATVFVHELDYWIGDLVVEGAPR